MASRAIGHEPLKEVVALTRARRCDLLRFWWRLARHRPVGRLPHVVVLECATLTAAADGPWRVQADGGVVGMLPMRFRVAGVPLAFC